MRQQRTANGSLDAAEIFAAVFKEVQTHFNLRLQVHFARLVGALYFFDIGKAHALAFRIDAFARHVIEAEYHVLRRHDNRLAVGRREDVVRAHHQRARFQLRFQRERYVHGHLVAVKVSVECSTNQRVQLNRLTFNQDRFKRLNAEAVQGWRTVEHDRVFADHVFQRIPDFRLVALHHQLRRFDSRCLFFFNQLLEDERFEQFQRHAFRQAALVQAQGRTNHDNGAAGVVDALAQQVLPETPLLALDHVGKRLQRTLVGTSDGATTTAVIEQRVNSFLQHPLLVADDDVRREQLQQALQAVVTVNDAAIEIVQIGSRKAAGVERHQRTQVRRQYRQHVENQPFRFADDFFRVIRVRDEGVNQVDALHQTFFLGFGRGLLQLFFQRLQDIAPIGAAQDFLNRFRAHHRLEFVTVFFHRIQIGFFVEQLVLFQRRHARIEDDEGFKIQYPLDFTQGEVKQQADARRQRFQKPDVRDWSSQFDMPHALTTHAGFGDFHATFFADNTAVLEALIFAAEAFVIFDRPEDFGAEQTVAFRLEGAVVDRFRFFDFAERPGADHVGRSEADADAIKVIHAVLRFEHIDEFFHVKTCLR